MLLSHWPYFQSPPMGTGYVHSSPPSTLPTLLAVVPRCIAPSTNVTGAFWEPAGTRLGHLQTGLCVWRDPLEAWPAKLVLPLASPSQPKSWREKFPCSFRSASSPPYPGAFRCTWVSGVAGGGSSPFQGTGGGECQCRCIS